MDAKKNIVLSVIIVLSVFLMSGCSSLKGYGKLGLNHGHDEKVTVQQLKKKWNDYTIHYSGLAVDQPSAVIFVPKEGRKTDVTDRWSKVDDQETLFELIDWIEIQDSIGPYPPRLWRILGPEDEFHGYMYTAWYHVLAKAGDDGTLLVYDMGLPPYLWINGPDNDRNPG